MVMVMSPVNFVISIANLSLALFFSVFMQDQSEVDEEGARNNALQREALVMLTLLKIQLPPVEDSKDPKCPSSA